MIRKTAFFEGWFCFKFNNLGLALGKNLKFYTSVAKGSKLKVRKFLGLIPMFVAVTGEKLVGGGGGFLPFWIGLTINSALPLIQLLLLNLSKKSDQVLSVCGALGFTFCFGLAGLIFTRSMSSDLLPSPFSLLNISISYRIGFFWYVIHFLSGFLSFPFAFRSKILKNFNFLCAF